jgi:photosystem II stability/assembly factor-like uncharacterized protein
MTGEHPSDTTSIVWTSQGPLPIASNGPDGSVYYSGQPPYSGRVTAIALDPTDTQVAYVGGAAGGVWKTSDGGVTWTPVFDAQPSLAIGSIAVDPSDPQTIFVGTGEANWTGDAYFGAGIFRSTDGGATWSQVGTPGQFDGCYIADMAVVPGAAGTVLAAVQSTGYLESPTSPCVDNGAGSGIWRSIDDGATWTHVFAGSARGSYFPLGTADLTVDPTTPSTWYAGDWDDGIVKSTDAGQTWTAANVGFPASKAGRIMITAGTGGRLYAVAGDCDFLCQMGRGGLMGVFTSSDSGATWAKVASPKSFCNLGGGPQCSYDLTIAVDPSNPSTFYVGGIYLFRSDDAGATYSFIGNDLRRPYEASFHQIHVDQHVVVAQGTALWVGNDGGVYRSTDAGATFTNLNGTLSITEFNPMISGTVAAGAPLVGGTQDNGTVKFTGSQAWTEIVSGDGGAAAVNPLNPAVIYSEYIELIVSKSIDGINFHQVTPYDRYGYPVACLGDIDRYGYPACEFYAPFAIDPAHPTTLYAGTNRVWRTKNGWKSIKPISPAFGGNVTMIAPAPSSSATVYAGTSSGGLRVTTNGGTTWRNTAGHGIPHRYVTDIFVDPANPSVAYASVSGFGSGHVFATSNAGGTWTDVSGNLPDAPVNAVAVDTATGALYVGTDVSVFSSTDGGATWSRYGTGLPAVVVMDLLPEPGGMIAATHGRGVFTVPTLTS